MKKIVLLFVFLTAISCKKEDKCDGIDCFTPPQTFIFELVDKTTGDNLFTTGSLNSSEITVVDENTTSVNFNFISENNLNLIELSEIGWNMGLNYYTVKVDSIEFTIFLEMESKHENCCWFFSVKQFNISNYLFEQSNATGVYKIIIE
ncbi:hypothetical protein R3X25_03725 [Lutibacter sp. TH_r2]|uniref:hypothetical protein n=1 Tax=Lutibacter sp. TH_r2 TaxID=3082083 RepID=UPI002953B91C|nr:hypothetical protein [Lutibacter sp. TH_r2]MDV7186380.1 hypothetical protein [Lutibacter sp. TH_r2]